MRDLYREVKKGTRSPQSRFAQLNGNCLIKSLERKFYLNTSNYIGLFFLQLITTLLGFCILIL